MTDAAASSATTFVSYAQITNPNISFDRAGNFYVLASYHNGGNTSGALILDKWDFSGGAPASRFTDNIIYQWVPASDAANNPTLVVDANPASFTDPVTGNVQTDPFAGGAPNHPNANVYAAWASTDIKPSLVTDLTNYNPNRIQLAVSSDGGNSFSSPLPVNVGGNFGTQRDSHPQVIINGTGQLTVGWSDFGTFSTATVPFSTLQSSSVDTGSAYTFAGQAGPIFDAGSDPRAYFAAPVIYNANPSPALPSSPVSIAIGTLDGKSGNDIVVSEKAVGKMGVLLNQGAGVSPPTSASIYDAGISPSGLTLGHFLEDSGQNNYYDVAMAAIRSRSRGRRQLS